MMEDVNLRGDKAFSQNSFSYYKNKGKNNIYPIARLLEYLFFWYSGTAFPED